MIAENDVIIVSSQSTLTVDDDTDSIVVVPGVESVSVVSAGLLGPMGPQGPPGPASGEITVTLPTVDTRMILNLDAGASGDVDGTIISNGSTGKLLAVSFGSSVAAKWEIKKISGVSSITVDVRYTGGFCNVPDGVWTTPHPDFVTLDGNGEDIFFRVTITNLDARNTADVHATLYMDEE